MGWPLLVWFLVLAQAGGWGPAPDVLVLVGEPDVGGLGHVQREQVVGLGGLPVDPGLDDPAELRSQPRVLLVHARAVQLDVAARVRLVAGHAVHCKAGISEQVPGLGGLPHHAKQHPACREVDLTGRQSRPAIRADSAKYHDLILLEPLLGQLGQVGAGGGELIPAHRVSLRRPARYSGVPTVRRRLRRRAGGAAGRRPAGPPRPTRRARPGPATGQWAACRSSWWPGWPARRSSGRTAATGPARPGS